MFKLNYHSALSTVQSLPVLSDLQQCLANIVALSVTVFEEHFVELFVEHFVEHFIELFVELF